MVTATTLKHWIVELIHSTGKWRMQVAERYPDDVRNRHSAEALHRLADLVGNLGDSEFAKLHRYVESAGGGVEGINLPDEIGRFGFERLPREVTYQDAIEALDWFYKASLASWRSGDVDPDDMPTDLALLLDFELGPASDRDDDAEADAIESVHARIDRIEARLVQVERYVSSRQMS